MYARQKRIIKHYKKRMKYRTKELTDEQKAKRKFRDSAVWKKFRIRLKKERKVDFITGKPLYSGFQVHHCDLNPEHYKDLIPDNYITLNRTFHRVIHEIYRYDWQDVLARLAIVFRKMDELNPERKREHQPELFGQEELSGVQEHLDTSLVSK